MLLEKSREIAPEGMNEAEPKRKQCPGVDMSGGERKVKSDDVKNNIA